LSFTASSSSATDRVTGIRRADGGREDPGTGVGGGGVGVGRANREGVESVASVGTKSNRGGGCAG
jgi:hypothetical protein